MTSKSRWRKAAAIVAGTAFGLVGVVGILHLPFARGLLMRAGGCPMAIQVTPEQLDRAHQSALAKEQGTEPAPERPALGFDLERTHRADVESWVSRAHLACQKDRGNVLRCNSVPPTAIGRPAVEGPVAILSFAFDANERLVDVSTMRMHLSSAAGLAAVTDIAGGLAKEIGAPHKQLGAFDQAHLSDRSVAGLSSIAYRFQDYAVDVIAMQVPTDGLVLREHYASIAHGS